MSRVNDFALGKQHLNGFSSFLRSLFHRTNLT